jgi:hypothetical protein
VERFVGINDGEKVHLKGLGITELHRLMSFCGLDSENRSVSNTWGTSWTRGKCGSIYSGEHLHCYEGMISKLRKAVSLNAAFIPINGRDAVRYKANCIGNLTYQEAVDLAGNTEARSDCSGYTMKCSSSISEDLRRNLPIIFAAKYPGLKYWIGSHFRRGAGHITSRSKNGIYYAGFYL